MSPTVSTPSSQRRVDLGLVVDQIRRRRRGARDLDEPVRVGRVARADHEQQVDLSRAGPSPPTGGSTSRSRCPLSSARGSREAPPDRVDDLGGVVDRQRRLRDVGDRSRRSAGRAPPRPRPTHEDRASGRLAHRPDDLLVAVVADQHDRVPVGGVAARLDVHLRDERAGRVDRVQASRAAAFARTDGATPCAEKTTVAPSGTSRSSSTKIAPRRLEVAHDVGVVDDLLAHVDGWAVQLERPLDGLDGALDPGAEPARRREKHSLHHGDDGSPAPAPTRQSSGPEKARRSGGSVRRAFSDCSPRARARYARRGSHRPVAGR